MKGILLIVIAALLIGGGWWLMKGNEASAPAPQEEMTADQNAEESDGHAVQGGTNVQVNVSPAAALTATKTVTVNGKNFSFTPNEIRVKKGDVVEIVFTSEQGTHDFVIDEFNARTKILKTGETDTIQFVAGETGTFEYYCSIGSHRQMGMVGKLIVEN